MNLSHRPPKDTARAAAHASPRTAHPPTPNKGDGFDWALVLVRRTSQAGPKPSAHGFDPQTHAAHTPHRRAPPHHLRHTHTPSKPWATRPHECMRRLASHVTPSSAHTHAPAMRPASHFSATRRPEPLAPRNCGSSARGDWHDTALQSRHTHTDSSHRHPTASLWDPHRPRPRSLV